MSRNHQTPHDPDFRRQVEEVRRLLKKRRDALRALAAGEANEEGPVARGGKSARAT